jgi:drug/metabolite transporter (DMT)-like permease
MTNDTKNLSLGLLGILGIWLTMGMMPIAELLGLTALEATLLRGSSGFIILGGLMLFYRRLVSWPDWNTARVVVLFALATLCLFQATTSWGASFMALFLDLAVLVPLAFAWWRGVGITRGTWFALTLAIVGTSLALRLTYGGVFSLTGFAWSIGALLCNGLFIVYASQATQNNWTKVFWMSAVLVLIGLPSLPEHPLFDAASSTGLLLMAFAIMTGMLNFLAGFIAFRHLSPVTVGVMVLGVTPSIMLSSYLILGRSLGPDQLLGVGLTLAAVLWFGQNLRQQDR